MPSIFDKRPPSNADAETASRSGSTLRTAKSSSVSAKIDDDQRSLGPDSRALNRNASVPEKYSESPRMLPVQQDPSKRKNNIYFDRRDVSIGKARYEGATHYSKNIAVKPNFIVGGGDLISHCNVEVELYDKNGKAVPLTERYFRDWAYYPTDPKVTIRTFRDWDGRVLPGKKEGLNLVPGSTKKFLWDGPAGGALTDAPGQQNIYQDKQTYFYLQEFVAGNNVSGGFYYQIEYMLDPDGTARCRARNKLELTPEDFSFAKKIMNSSSFATEYKDRFLIQDLPGTIDSDSGLDTTIPDMVRKKKERGKNTKRK